MYIPEENKLEDRNKIIAFMRRYSFATIITTADDGKPLASHIPFHIKTVGNDIILTAHFAKANRQWKTLQQTLVVFQSPHAYISPSHYNKQENVPTWNYVAVHAYGAGELVTEKTKGIEILEEMMRQSEPTFLEQWKSLDAAYIDRLYNGIVPFTITVKELHAKHKLSQNKQPEERMRIIETLSQEADGAANDLAAYMRDNEQDIA